MPRLHVATTALHCPSSPFSTTLRLFFFFHDMCCSGSCCVVAGVDSWLADALQGAVQDCHSFLNPTPTPPLQPTGPVAQLAAWLASHAAMLPRYTSFESSSTAVHMHPPLATCNSASADMQRPASSDFPVSDGGSDPSVVCNRSL